MSEIFISYARSTAVAAREVAQALRSQGFEVWMDEQLAANRSFADAIEERLGSADAVVVIWSTEAVRSPWVRSEASRALEVGKLVQLRLDAARLPMPFDQIHCADLSAWPVDAGSPHWRAVLDGLAAVTGAQQVAKPAPSAPARLPQEILPPGERPTLSRPGRPSIAVLPFKNLSADPEQEYFADAISEELVTALSRWHWFFVIASDSSSTYKSREVDLKRVGQELGVRYLLDGSVRKVGNRVRVTAQLVDVAGGSHVWADKFDRELVDILALQDEITEKVVAAIEPAMLHSEGSRIVRKSLTDYSALDCFHRGMWHLNRVSLEGYTIALSLFREAVARDSELSLGHIGLSRILYGGAVFGWSPQPPEDLREARASAQAAISLDSGDACAFFASSGASMYLGDHGGALAEAQRSISLNPNFAPGQVRLGQVLIFSGRPSEAIAPLERGIRLSPYDSQLAVMLDSLALAHYQARDYEQAVVYAQAAMHQRHLDGSVLLAASLAQLGRTREAFEVMPPARRDQASAQRPMAAPYANPAHLEHLREGVRLARNQSPS